MLPPRALLRSPQLFFSKIITFPLATHQLVSIAIIPLLLLLAVLYKFLLSARPSLDEAIFETTQRRLGSACPLTDWLLRRVDLDKMRTPGGSSLSTVAFSILHFSLLSCIFHVVADATVNGGFCSDVERCSRGDLANSNQSCPCRSRVHLKGLT